MKITEINENVVYYAEPEEQDCDLDEKASRKLCLSHQTDKQIGASNASSCISQGLRKRRTRKQHTIDGKRVSIYGQKVKGKKYGGPLPSHS